MSTVIYHIKKISDIFSFPQIGVVDILEMCIIAFALYNVTNWIRKTRAWSLVKGIMVFFVIYIIAYFSGMNVILWVFNKTIAIGITALFIVFQPELRKALDELGQKQFFSSLFPQDDEAQSYRYSDRTISEVVKACTELSKTKTGALIVIEKEILLTEYERTGIIIDSAISSQLLINIFEHNTPLHDGAVIMRGDRIVAATCYLPLSDNTRLSKELGTRHRAAVGVSEVTDSLTIIVSEETGAISLALGGKLIRNIDGELLKKHMNEHQAKPGNIMGKKRRGRKNRKKK